MTREQYDTLRVSNTELSTTLITRLMMIKHLFFYLSIAFISHNLFVTYSLYRVALKWDKTDFEWLIIAKFFHIGRTGQDSLFSAEINDTKIKNLVGYLVLSPRFLKKWSLRSLQKEWKYNFCSKFTRISL